MGQHDRKIVSHGLFDLQDLISPNSFSSLILEMFNFAYDLTEQYSVNQIEISIFLAFRTFGNKTTI